MPVVATGSRQRRERGVAAEQGRRADSVPAARGSCAEARGDPYARCDGARRHVRGGGEPVASCAGRVPVSRRAPGRYAGAERGGVLRELLDAAPMLSVATASTCAPRRASAMPVRSCPANCWRTTARCWCSARRTRRSRWPMAGRPAGRAESAARADRAPGGGRGWGPLTWPGGSANRASCRASV